ncbi:MAG: hypothetical protein GF398_00585 [Chitinivibrionales bacterium]|nr:hypothetical protein [Chitinivibrionales bacterium]
MRAFTIIAAVLALLIVAMLYMNNLKTKAEAAADKRSSYHTSQIEQAEKAMKELNASINRRAKEIEKLQEN